MRDSGQRLHHVCTRNFDWTAGLFRLLFWFILLPVTNKSPQFVKPEHGIILMLMNLLLGLSTMALCLLLQSLLLVVAIRYYTHQQQLRQSRSIWSNFSIINGVMLLLVIGNLTQVAIWALLFRILGEFTDFYTAFYHSAVNFATLGYGDIVMTDEHKLLGPLQSVNGVLMIGISTAFLMTAFQDAMKKSL